MRLTLRTLLCYLDDVLEPADAEILGQKIEQSKIAGEMVHRIRSSVRKLRLASPSLWSEGGSVDLNTVADYLDNTLADEKIAEVEAICQESEVHLAEIAACHQVLTLVLGEPAEVPAAMRDRVYALASVEGQTVERARLDAATGEPAKAASSNGHAATAEPPVSQPKAPPVDSKKDPQASTAATEAEESAIPDYLRSGQSSALPKVLLALAALLLVAIGLFVFWPKEKTPVASREGSTTQGSDKHADKSTQGDPLFNVAGETADHSASTTTAAGSGATAGTSLNSPTGTSLNGGTTVSPVAPNVDLVRVTPSPPAATDVVDNPTAGGTEPLPNDSGPPRVGGDVMPDSGTVDAVASVDPDVSRPTPPADAGEEPPAVPTLPPSGKVLGHYISSEEILTRFDRKVGQWMRLPERTEQAAGDILRVLPTYRPQILLENNIQITLAGQADVAFGESTDDDSPTLAVNYGQAVIATMGKADVKMNLMLAGRPAKVTLANADAVIAVHVLPFLLPGERPEDGLPHTAIDVYVAGGAITWAEGDSAIDASAGQMLRMLDRTPAELGKAAAMPVWVKTNDISDIDRHASATMHPMVPEDRPVTLTLQEVAEKDHRVEVRSLAMRGLATLGQYDQIVGSFDEPDLKSYWAAHLAELRDALARGEQQAAEIRMACQRQHGEFGDAVYDLLIGYSADDLTAGGAEQLVNYLEHDRLDLRVLAINNLRNITGRTNVYNPHVPAARRKAAVLRWRENLAAGEVVYAKEPLKLPRPAP